MYGCHVFRVGQSVLKLLEIVGPYFTQVISPQGIRFKSIFLEELELPHEEIVATKRPTVFSSKTEGPQIAAQKAQKTDLRFGPKISGDFVETES